jgi:DNA repair protein RadC
MDKETSFTIHDLPKPERPRERLQKFGPEALSAQELLALVIGRGIPKKSVMNISQELLAKFGNIKAISEASLEELSQIKGIGNNWIIGDGFTFLIEDLKDELKKALDRFE